MLRLAAAVIAAVLTLPVAAQDSRSFAAQSAARAWLALTDRLEAAQSWDAASDKFRTSMALAKWTAALQQARGPLGPIVQRTMLSTRFEQTPQGFPAGDYVVILFRSSFANKTMAQESVTLERDGSGVWRVVGYLIS